MNEITVGNITLSTLDGKSWVLTKNRESCEPISMVINHKDLSELSEAFAEADGNSRLIQLKAKERDITSLEEISEPGKRYFIVENGERTGRWFEIEIARGEDVGRHSHKEVYCIGHGHYEFQIADWVYDGDEVKSWVTFSGAKRYIQNKLQDI